jgi:hypothetical protein
VSKADLRQYEENQTARLLISAGSPLNPKQCSLIAIEVIFKAHEDYSSVE